MCGIRVTTLYASTASATAKYYTKYCVGGQSNLPSGGQLGLPTNGHLNADSDGADMEVIAALLGQRIDEWIVGSAALLMRSTGTYTG